MASGGEGGPGGWSAERSLMLKAVRLMPPLCSPAALAAAMITCPPAHVSAGLACLQVEVAGGRRLWHAAHTRLQLMGMMPLHLLAGADLAPCLPVCSKLESGWLLAEHRLDCDRPQCCSMVAACIGCAARTCLSSGYSLDRASASPESLSPRLSKKRSSSAAQ